MIIKKKEIKIRLSLSRQADFNLLLWKTFSPIVYSIRLFFSCPFLMVFTLHFFFIPNPSWYLKTLFNEKTSMLTEYAVIFYSNCSSHPYTPPLLQCMSNLPNWYMRTHLEALKIQTGYQKSRSEKKTPKAEIQILNEEQLKLVLVTIR